MAGLPIGLRVHTLVGGLGVARASQAEFHKLRKRPAMWVLLLVLIATVIFLNGYVYYYLDYLIAVTGHGDSGDIPGMDLAQIMPGSLVPSVLSYFSLWDYLVAIVLGALVAGGEYDWGTLKTAATQQPSRLSVYLGKVLAMWMVTALMVALVFASAAVASVALKHLLSVQLRAMLGPEGVALVAPGLSGADQQFFQGALAQMLKWPPLSDVLGGIGVEWLVMAMWASMGMVFSILFRSSAVAIGMGMGGGRSRLGQR